MNKENLTPRYARYLIHFVRPFPNFDFFFIKPLRRKASDLLALKLGDRVLDMGCGIGGSFPPLVEAVGPSGQIIGVEISPEVIINTTKRIEKNGWSNVEVLQASAQHAKLSGMFDGLLMFATPDVYGSEEALKNILPHLKRNSRVVIFGAKTSRNRLGRLANSVLKKVITKLSFSTTPLPTLEPWHIVEKYTDGLIIQEYFFGYMFLASGNVKEKI